MSKLWVLWLSVVAASFGGLEALGYIKYGTPGTLSAYVRSWSALHPLVPFSIGCLVGGLALHFWAMRNG